MAAAVALPLLIALVSSRLGQLLRFGLQKLVQGFLYAATDKFLEFALDYDQFTGWADEFDAASMERKRTILSELFSRIELDRGYEIRFEVDLNYRQFLEGIAPDIPLAV